MCVCRQHRSILLPVSWLAPRTTLENASASVLDVPSVHPKQALAPCSAQTCRAILHCGTGHRGVKSKKEKLEGPPTSECVTFTVKHSGLQFSNDICVATQSCRRGRPSSSCCTKRRALANTIFGLDVHYLAFKCIPHPSSPLRRTRTGSGMEPVRHRSTMLGHPRFTRSPAAALACAPNRATVRSPTAAIRLGASSRAWTLP